MKKSFAVLFMALFALIVVAVPISQISELNASAATTVATPSITGFNNETNGVRITWGKVSGASQYRVFYKGKSGWKGMGNTSSTSFVDTDVSSGSTYTYTVRCLDSSGNFISGYNSTGWKYTFVATPSITKISSVSTGVKIEWSAVKGASKYRVFYKGKSGWKGMDNTASTSYIDTDVRDGGTYTYTVRCLDSNGNFVSGYNSTGWKFTYSKPSLDTPQITGFQNVSNGIKITWGKVTGATKYRVFYKGKSGWVRLGTTTSTSMVDDDVRSGNSYTYTVRCVDDNDNYVSGYYSAGWSYKFYSAPTLTKAEKVSNGVKVSWSSTSDIVKFRVYVKTSGTGWKSIGETRNNYFIHTTPESGNTYIYTVRIVSDDGNSYLSSYDTQGISYIYSTENLTVTATSNLFPTAKQTFDANTGTITVTYYISSSMSLLNTQWKLTYDPTVLKYNASNNSNVENFMPSVSSGSLSNQFDTGTIIGDSVNLKLDSISTSSALVSVTFDVLKQGDTTVNLDMEFLTLANQGSNNLVSPSTEVEVVDKSEILDSSVITSASTKVYAGKYTG